MVLDYDSDLDLLYIKLCDGLSAASIQVQPGIVLDYDRNHRVIGIEIENASENVDRTCLRVSGFDLAGRLPARKKLVER
jgi:uncharacterized protein YuzE